MSLVRPSPSSDTSAAQSLPTSTPGEGGGVASLSTSLCLTPSVGEGAARAQARTSTCTSLRLTSAPSAGAARARAYTLTSVGDTGSVPASALSYPRFRRGRGAMTPASAPGEAAERLTALAGALPPNWRAMRGHNPSPATALARADPLPPARALHEPRLTPAPATIEGKSACISPPLTQPTPLARSRWGPRPPPPLARHWLGTSFISLPLLPAYGKGVARHVSSLLRPRRGLA